MKMTTLRAAILAVGVAALATPAMAQSSPASPDTQTGGGTPRNAAPKGNVGTSSNQATGQSGAAMTSPAKKKSRAHHARSHHPSRHSMARGSTTGMGSTIHRPGNPNNGGPYEGIRNEAPKGNVSGNTAPSR